MYSETNKEIKSYRNSALQFSQLAEIQVSSSLSLPLECSKSEGFWALLSSRVQGHLYVHCSKNFLLNLYTKNKEES